MPTKSTTSGIYMIRCIPNSRVYIGSAIDIEGRWGHHRRRLALHKHINGRLQNAWNKHGCDAFTWEILERVEPARLIEREQHYIDLYKSADRNRGFNINPTAGSALGAKHTDEAIKKMTEFQRKRFESPEARAKMGAGNRGKPISSELREKIAEANKKREWSPEQRAKMSASQKERFKSPAARAKMASLTRGRIVSLETRAKIARSLKRRSRREPAKHFTQGRLFD
jgi:group I intron endonuclease